MVKAMISLRIIEHEGQWAKNRVTVDWMDIFWWGILSFRLCDYTSTEPRVVEADCALIHRSMPKFKQL
jgi:hypothetical protein